MSNQNLIIFIVFIFHKTKYITKKLQNKIYMVSVKLILQTLIKRLEPTTTAKGMVIVVQFNFVNNNNVTSIKVK